MTEAQMTDEAGEAEPIRPSAPRRATLERATAETTVEVSIDLDGNGRAEVSTGVPFFDHMLAQLARHSGADVLVRAKGDLEVDAHHLVEDVGICLGRALGTALGERIGVRRFASMALPLDEALVEVALDLSGRPFLYVDLGLSPESPPLGNPGFAPQLAEEFWRALVHGAGLTLHLVTVRGRNPHHVVEASFKAVARALRDATRIDHDRVPSTKEWLEAPGATA